MSRGKQWIVTLALSLTFGACGVFGVPSVKDGKVCEVIDFGGGAKFEVCAGTAAQLAIVKQEAAERKSRFPQ